LRTWFAGKTLPEKEKSYLSQLMSGKASFGERAARRLERDYEMGAGYLDLAGPMASEPGPQPYHAHGSSELLDNWELLLEDDRQRIASEIARLADIARTYRARFGGQVADNDRVTAALPSIHTTKESQ
jgi:hypothetical protein